MVCASRMNLVYRMIGASGRRIEWFVPPDWRKRVTELDI